MLKLNFLFKKKITFKKEGLKVEERKRNLLTYFLFIKRTIKIKLKCFLESVKIFRPNYITYLEISRTNFL